MVSDTGETIYGVTCQHNIATSKLGLQVTEVTFVDG